MLTGGASWKSWSEVLVAMGMILGISMVPLVGICMRRLWTEVAALGWGMEIRGGAGWG